MIVPEFWSEYKIKKRVDGRQFTIKRFGWSDISEEDALLHAQTRVKEAEAELAARGDVRRIDRKVAYNGAEGVPIREEIVARHQDVIITRNAYGALCLNTPDVLFADIDFQTDAPFRLYVSVFILFVMLSGFAILWLANWPMVVIALLASLVLSASLTQGIYRLYLAMRGGSEAIALKTIKQFCEKHPDINLHLYKTPLGFRALIMNETFEPKSAKALRILEELKADPLYTQMCRNQNCFRARISPKPWRIGLDRIKPRPGIWPIKTEYLRQRQAWIRHYQQAARHYAACHFVQAFGSSDCHPKAKYVKHLHDQASQAMEQGLKMG